MVISSMALLTVEKMRLDYMCFGVSMVSSIFTCMGCVLLDYVVYFLTR